ncbi:MAG: hypothetical protein COX80_01210 [Candidatus Magasanikbacteria bacterium CG_4_10_14_0_2_um_filter_33_14]|uniref:DUF1648 domain-containing protein n=1 Tax=Candidatus Magasanikbacteria bacterium CG_4_10_14_0_2_um_filter_33_14 TaxID=1974636 RepID=A0A2M7VBI7_9BACT|nr:MAG: hypothetical protein COX80_01210 [Candidatus Magasanikbacteria bacterium CG_4_10_14_0_2_um_filter_33_14]
MKLRLYPLKLYFFSLPITIMTILSLLLNLFSWFWLKSQLPNTSELFLHYNVLFGVDYIGDSWKIFFVPLIGLIILSVNFFMGWLLYKKDKFMAYVLNSVSVLCQIFLFMVSFLLVFLNV